MSGFTVKKNKTKRFFAGKFFADSPPGLLLVLHNTPEVSFHDLNCTEDTHPHYSN